MGMTVAAIGVKVSELWLIGGSAAFGLLFA
jgi:hypothetical protein